MSATQTILLPIGDDLYALPIGWVREVLAAPTVTRLPTAPALVLGLINLRGEIVPLLDGAALLGVGTVESAAFAVVLHTPHGSVALAVTGFPERAALDLPTGRSDIPGTAGTYQLGRRVAVLLDPAVMLVPERLFGHAVAAGQLTAGAA